MLVLQTQSFSPCCDDGPKIFSDLKQMLKLLHSLHLLCGLVWATEKPFVGCWTLRDPHDV